MRRGFSLVTAPMTGISDRAARAVWHGLGADLTTTECASVPALLAGDSFAWRRVAVDPTSAPTIAQLAFGPLQPSSPSCARPSEACARLAPMWLDSAPLPHEFQLSLDMPGCGLPWDSRDFSQAPGASTPQSGAPGKPVYYFLSATDSSLPPSSAPHLPRVAAELVSELNKAAHALRSSTQTPVSLKLRLPGDSPAARAAAAAALLPRLDFDSVTVHSADEHASSADVSDAAAAFAAADHNAHGHESGLGRGQRAERGPGAELWSLLGRVPMGATDGPVLRLSGGLATAHAAAAAAAATAAGELGATVGGVVMGRALLLEPRTPLIWRARLPLLTPPHGYLDGGHLDGGRAAAVAAASLLAPALALAPAAPTVSLYTVIVDYLRCMLHYAATPTPHSTEAGGYPGGVDVATASALRLLSTVLRQARTRIAAKATTALAAAAAAHASSPASSAGSVKGNGGGPALLSNAPAPRSSSSSSSPSSASSWKAAAAPRARAAASKRARAWDAEAAALAAAGDAAGAARLKDIAGRVAAAVAELPVEAWAPEDGNSTFCGDSSSSGSSGLLVRALASLWASPAPLAPYAAWQHPSLSGQWALPPDTSSLWGQALGPDAALIVGTSALCADPRFDDVVAGCIAAALTQTADSIGVGKAGQGKWMSTSAPAPSASAAAGAAAAESLPFAYAYNFLLHMGRHLAGPGAPGAGDDVGTLLAGVSFAPVKVE